MPLINYKVELKLKWTNHCALQALGADNVDGNSNNITFTIKNTKLYLLVVTLSAKDIQKLQKIFSKGFERSAYWNEYKTKIEMKNTTSEYRYFFESNFLGVNRIFVLFYSNVDDNAKRYKARRYHLSKVVIKNYFIIVNRKNFYDQPTNSYKNKTKK